MFWLQLGLCREVAGQAEQWYSRTVSFRQHPSFGASDHESLFYEVWAGEEAFDAHGKTPHMKALGGKSKGKTDKGGGATFYMMSQSRRDFLHANLRQVPLTEAKDLILRCLDVFSNELKDFDAKKAVYNFAYNASTPELEAWLPTQVRGFRTGRGAINSLPHKGQAKLTCTSFGPGNCEHAIDREIEKLLTRETGWLIFNTHGLDDEGWGPIRATYLDRLLDKLSAVESVDILPAGRALEECVARP